MKVNCPKHYPYNFVFGFTVSEHFSHNIPNDRGEITKLTKTPEFQETVYATTAKFNEAVGTKTNEELAKFLKIEIILLEKDETTTFGAGKYI